MSSFIWTCFIYENESLSCKDTWSCLFLRWLHASLPLLYSLTVQARAKWEFVSWRLVLESWQGCCQFPRAGIGGDIVFTAVLSKTVTGPDSQEVPNDRRSLGGTVAQVRQGHWHTGLEHNHVVCVQIWMWSDDWGWQPAFHQHVGWLGRCWPLENSGLRETELSFFSCIFKNSFFYFYFLKLIN